MERGGGGAFHAGREAAWRRDGRPRTTDLCRAAGGTHCAAVYGLAPGAQPPARAAGAASAGRPAREGEGNGEGPRAGIAARARRGAVAGHGTRARMARGTGAAWTARARDADEPWPASDRRLGGVALGVGRGAAADEPWPASDRRLDDLAAETARARDADESDRRGGGGAGSHAGPEPPAAASPPASIASTIRPSRTGRMFLRFIFRIIRWASNGFLSPLPRNPYSDLNRTASGA